MTKEWTTDNFFHFPLLYSGIGENETMKTLKTALLTGLFSFSLPVLADTFVAPISQADCQNDYLTLMSKPEINMTIAYGYFDAGDGTTWDKKFADHFITTMTKSCKTWDLKACGFKKTGANPTILTRKMTGPDGLIKTIRIKIDNPSVSTDENANQKNAAQKVRSEAVKKLYLDGLRNSEITIYLGHSRDGGGPDFDPPIKRKDGHTDYDYYHANPKDKKEVMKVLAETPNKSRILGFFSCSSIRWFSKGVASGAPGSGFIGTDDLFYVSNFNQVFPFIEKIFSYQCIDKLIVPDENKHGNLKSQKKWKVPASDSKIPKNKVIESTLEKLASQLSSKDVEVRREAYREITSFDKKYYTPKVWEALNAYNSGRVFGQYFN